MKAIRHTTTLFYYDGPQVFEARDAIGGHYVAVMIESDGKDQYLVAGVEPERLRQFRTGMIDLRSLLVERTIDDWFLTDAPSNWNEQFILQTAEGSLSDSIFLPEAGFTLHDLPEKGLALEEARSRNNLVFEVAVEPPEAAEGHRIRIRTLAILLGHVQTMIKHAYGSALRDLTPELKRVIPKTDAYLMDVVVPASPGSFRVVLEAANTPDMLGQNELARALERLDKLFANSENPKEVLSVVKAHRGHLAGAYLRFLRFLVEHKTGLRYSWAEPNFSKPIHRSITQAEAGPLVDILSGVSNLAGESITLIGIFEKANRGTGAWGLMTEEKVFSGKVKDDGPSLEGLKIGATYKFSCIEEIEEVEGTGREQRTLYLIEHEPV